MKKVKLICLFLLLGILFGLISDYLVSHIEYRNSDFFSFWLAGRMILSHKNPYLADEWISGHHLYGAEWISDTNFLYPLPLAILFTPFGWLNLFQAYVSWVWFSQVVLLVTALSLMPLFGSNGKPYLLPVISGIILFRPIVSLLLNGQLGAFLLLSVAMAGILWDKKRWISGGTIITFSILKPNIGVPLIALISAYLFVHKNYKGFIGMMLSLIAMSMIAWLYYPNWIWQYLEVLKSKQAQTFGFSPTIWGLSAFISKFNLQRTLLIGGLLTILLIVFYLIMITKLKNITPLVSVSLSVALTLLITPYLWPYDQIILVLPIVVIMAFLKKLNTSYLCSALFFLAVDVVGIVLFWFSTKILMENLNGLLPLLVLVMLSLVLFQYRTIATELPSFAQTAGSTSPR